MMASTNKSLRKFSVTTLALLLLAIIVVAARAQEANTQPPQTSRIVLTAVDKNLRFVTTLKAEDLQILEDGKAQRITGFQQVTNQPVALAILIDSSASQEKTLPEQKLAATSFIDSIIRAGKDEAAVATFTGTLRVEQKLTNEVTLLHQAIARAEFVPPPGYRGGGLVVGPLPPISRTPAMLAGSTAIWDAVLTACHDLLLPSGGPGRHAIILLTDGEDTISQSKMSDAVDRAIRDNVAIYSIGIGDTGLYGVDKDGLRKLSERTGGRAFFPKHGADFQNIFAEIGEDLRTQYIITYTPTTSAGPARKIKVEIVNPALRKADIQLSYQQVRPRK
jgi:Ca-activated chloride channel family protein